MWYGAVCPWHQFLDNDVIPLYRLVPLGILILLFRRLPWVFAIHKKIPQIEEFRQAIFVGFFGPVGVSAVFYLYITIEFVNTIKGSDGELRSDVAKLPEAVLIIVWFLCVCSVVSSTCFLCSKLVSNYFSSGRSRTQHPPWKTRLLPTTDPIPRHHLRRRRRTHLPHWQPCKHNRPPPPHIHCLPT